MTEDDSPVQDIEYAPERTSVYFGRGLLSMQTHREALHSAEFAEFETGIVEGKDQVRRQWAHIHRVTLRDRTLDVTDLYEFRLWLIQRPGGWAYEVFANRAFFRFERAETAMEFMLVWSTPR